MFFPNKMQGKKVFVTVGTTQFDKLIEKVSSEEILDILYKLGYSKIQFQIGQGKIKENAHKHVELKYDRYFENFSEQINEADLVLSHAGAGTCLEVLKAKKPLIVIINEDLMDNHQIELARQLAKDDHLKYCIPNDLREVLLENKFNNCKRYPEPNRKVFSDYLDKSMGFEVKQT